MFITSDLHFDHKNATKFAPTYRPWETLEEMNQGLIEAWNEKVTTPNVKMFHLGDFCFSTPERTEEIVSQLKGDITFLIGNHDHSRYQEVLRKYGKVCHYLEVKYNKNIYILSHYPFLDWNRRHHGTIMLHGHEHGNIKDTEESRGKTMDVGWDSIGKILHFDEIESIMASRIITNVGHH